MKPALNLYNVILNNPSRLRHIIRFSNCPRIHNESVAEHSFYTAFYAYTIGHALLMEGEELDMGTLLGKALVHDIDECYSGDFIRMFKHSSPELKQEIDKACQRFTASLMHELVDNNALGGIFYSDWMESKHGIEGKIVAFADFLSVLSYISQELRLGNIDMRRQLPELRKFLMSFERPEYFTLLSSYVLEAYTILESMEKEALVAK